jgi:2,4-dienoyl-CoA reductase-like NADH-dependent reductase (Old Yellow Enzyme family)
MRLALAVAHAVRAAVPENIAVGIRLSATDWADGGFTPDEAVVVARAVKEAGLVYVCCSSGGVAHDQTVPLAPGYQVHLAEKVRREAGIPTRAVGLIDDPHQAEAIVADGKADMVALARAMLGDPRWPLRAAAALGQPVHPVAQYAASAATIARWVAPVV